MFDREPDYVILSGGGDIEDPDKLVKDWLEELDRKVQDGQEN